MNSISRWLLGFASVGGTAVFADEPARNGRPILFQPRVDEAITPITARFLERIIAQAEEEGAVCLIRRARVVAAAGAKRKCRAEVFAVETTTL